ncbi:MAG: ComF family protein [Cetobacterium sp.]|uniref:ComF family protein n=1 Tax=Cetobacterium sp. TaxID=2071632 RepID=UPI003F2C3891
MKKHPIKLEGLWTEGYSLDKHVESSTYLGEDIYGNASFCTKRTFLGELMYQLKYHYDFSKIQEITDVAVDFIQNDWEILDQIDGILPVPSSKKREIQPVYQIVKLLSDKLGKPHCLDFFEKISTEEIKNLTEDEREKVLQDGVKKNRKLLKKASILIVDDLYDTGASLKRVTQLLQEDENIKNIYVLTITKTKKS